MVPVSIRRLRAAPVALLLILVAALCLPAQAGDRVLLLEIEGAISVAAARQLSRAIDDARKAPTAAIVMQLNTPGGLVSVTRDMIKDIVAAPVPIIVYVAPSGARAASAGTFLVYASHLAAMAPGTNLGAATPVTMGGLPGLPQQNEKKNEPSAGKRKAINDVVGLLRSLAQLRGRNIDFAERAVREAATMTADEAGRENVVEIVAPTLNEVLAQADGRTVKVGSGERRLATKDVAIQTVPIDWRTRLLAIIADPNVAFILLLVGIYGILFEFWNPGTFVPGTVGAISLVLALIALSALPVQYGALALLLLGIGLMVAEAFTPGIGILGIGGLVAFLVGSFFLFEPQSSEIDYSVSLPVVIGAALACAGLSFVVLGAALQARRRPAVTGTEELIGSRGTVTEWQGRSGQIRVHGELWSARAGETLQAGITVRVKGRDGLILTVEPE
jgi:membrane-bound serine protease (ClpP class)